MKRLTPCETSLLAYLAGHIEARGYGPSYRDIGRVVGLRSSSRVAIVVDSLEAKGAVRRLPGRARALTPVTPVAVPRAPDGEPLFFVKIRGVE